MAVSDLVNLSGLMNDAATPMVSRPACLHGDRAGALPFEERKQLFPVQLASDHNLPCAIHRVDLEN